jgi:uncharacterized protein (DUF3820 family)
MNLKYEFAYTKVPFGKYRGWFLKDVPDNYVQWALINHNDRGICEMMAVEWQRRHPEYRKTPK